MSPVRNKITSVKRLSALAQLVAQHRERGVTTTVQLAAVTGRSERQIWRAKAELKAANVTLTQASGYPDINVTDASVSHPDTNVRVSRARIKNNSYLLTKDSKTPTNSNPFFPREDADPDGSEKGLPETASPSKAESQQAEPVALVGGQLVLSPAEATTWAAQLGGERALELALLEVVVWVQPNSNRPLLAQVRAQLARRARDKTERDARYAAAAAKRSHLPPWEVEKQRKQAEWGRILRGEEVSA